jgi:hypothetical protein
MTVDPFGETPDDELFNQPTQGGSYPKVEELIGCLVMITPYMLEFVPNRFGKPGDTQERYTCDVVVLDGPEGNEYIGTEHERMYLSVFSGTLRTQLKRRKPALGTIRRYPANGAEYPKGTPLTTPEEYEEAYELWLKKGGRGKAPQFAWSLAEFTANDATKARTYLATKVSPFAE